MRKRIEADGPASECADEHVRPYVHEGLDSKSMHFSICEIQSRMSLTDPDALDLEYTRTASEHTGAA